MKANEISPIPDLPGPIINAIRRQKFAVFIGAGISRLVGCLGWDQLAFNLVDLCAAEKGTTPPLINYKEAQTLKSRSDHRRTITVIHDILKEDKREAEFYDEVERALAGDPSQLAKANIYDDIYKLRALFLTTNADLHFDKKFVRPVYMLPEFNKDHIDRNKLFHIHGSIIDKASLVFRLDEYLKRYSTDTQFGEFISTIFNNYTILFLGYGLNEFELLEFLVRGKGTKSDGEVNHYALLGYYRGESNLVGIDQLYYNRFGIEIVAFEMDLKGFQQQAVVVQEWASEIDKVSPYLYSSLTQIEDAVTNVSPDKIVQTLQLIQNDVPQQDFLFTTLAKANDPIPWIEPLKRQGYFDPARMPRPIRADDGKGVTIPPWIAMEVLVRSAEVAANHDDAVAIASIREIVTALVGLQANPETRVDNYRVDWTILRVLCWIPVPMLQDSDYEFLRIALTSRYGANLISADLCTKFLPHVVKGNSEGAIVKLCELLFAFQRNRDRETSSEFTSIVDEYWLKEGIEKHWNGVDADSAIASARKGLETIRQIVDQDKSQFNNIWIVTIEENEQNLFPDRYEYQLVAFVRDILVGTEASRVRSIVVELLAETHPIFQRLAIHVISMAYEKLKDVFWSITFNPLDNELLKHETYELLRLNALFLNKEELRRVITWIDSIDFYIPEELKGDTPKIEKIIAIRKREWLSALVTSKDSEILRLYAHYEQINSAKLDHPGYPIWTSASDSIVEESPINPSELQAKSNLEIVELLNNFVPSDPFAFSEDGLSGILRLSVVDSPSKYALELKPFLRIARRYQHSLLVGFLEAWKAGNDIAWDQILDFIHELIARPEFWSESFTGPYDYRNWIVLTVAEMMQAGTNSDDRAFDPGLFPAAIEILLLLARKTQSQSEEIRDVVTTVLNSPKGKVYCAMVLLSLRIARVERKEQDRWNPALKADFESRLDRESESSFDLSVILGQFIRNLLYLDKEWVVRNINRIFPARLKKQWEATMVSYLFYAVRWDQGLYSLLKNNDHYQLALDSGLPEKEATRRLVQHICLAYVYGIESAENDDSLISRMIARLDLTNVRTISMFLSDRKVVGNAVERERALDLWRRIVELWKAKGNQELPKMRSEVLRFVDLIDELDEKTVQLIEYSIEGLEEDFGVFKLVEALARLVTKQPSLVGRIFMRLIGQGLRPIYKREAIEMIVDGLYQNGETHVADQVCNDYGKNGIFFLRPIYERNQPMS